MQADAEQSATETNEEIEPLLSDEPSQHDQQIQGLSNDLARERDARKEESLVWILISLILLNVAFFSSMQSILRPLVIGAIRISGTCNHCPKNGKGRSGTAS